MMMKNVYLVLLVFLVTFLLFFLLTTIILSNDEMKFSIYLLRNTIENNCKKLFKNIVKLLYKLKNILYNKFKENK